MATSNTNPEPQLNITFNNMSKVELYEAFFMKDFIKDTLSVNMNNNINRKQVPDGATSSTITFAFPTPSATGSGLPLISLLMSRLIVCNDTARDNLDAVAFFL